MPAVVVLPLGEGAGYALGLAANDNAIGLVAAMPELAGAGGTVAAAIPYVAAAVVIGGAAYYAYKHWDDLFPDGYPGMKHFPGFRLACSGGPFNSKGNCPTLSTRLFSVSFGCPLNSGGTCSGAGQAGSVKTSVNALTDGGVYVWQVGEPFAGIFRGYRQLERWDRYKVLDYPTTLANAPALLSPLPAPDLSLAELLNPAPLYPTIDPNIPLALPPGKADPMPVPGSNPSPDWDPQAGSTVKWEYSSQANQLTTSKSTGLQGNPKPPGKGEKEGKAKAKGAFVWQFFDQLSEAADVVDAVFDALPEEVKKKWKKGHKKRQGDSFGQYGINGVDWKLLALWHNWDKLDLAKAAANVLANEVSDRLYGRGLGAKGDVVKGKYMRGFH